LRKWMLPKCVSIFDDRIKTFPLLTKYCRYLLASYTNRSGFIMQCISTDVSSPWNFYATPDATWSSVPASTFTANSFPVDWFTNGFSGTTVALELSTSPFGLTCPAPFNTNSGNVNYKVRGPLNRYFTFRKTVQC
jgi:hypothetical protein